MYRKSDYMEALFFKMVTMCVSRDSLALLLTEEELSDVRGAVRLSLESAGLEPWHDLEAERASAGAAGSADMEAHAMVYKFFFSSGA